MAARLSQAARRVAQQQWRGLANALTEGQAVSSSGGFGQQPMAALALRAHSSSSSGGRGGGTSGLPAAAAEALRLGEAGPAISQQPQQQSAQQQSPPPPPPQQQRQPVPEGSTDFSRKDLVMLFTCAKCNTRAARAFSRASYERGVVIVDCPGCHSKHLIADHLGFFGQKGTVEEFAAEKGNVVTRKLADGTLTLTPEEMLGPSLLAQQQQPGGEAGEGHEQGTPGAAAAQAAVGQGQ